MLDNPLQWPAGGGVCLHKDARLCQAGLAISRLLHMPESLADREKGAAYLAGKEPADDLVSHFLALLIWRELVLCLGEKRGAHTEQACLKPSPESCL